VTERKREKAGERKGERGGKRRRWKDIKGKGGEWKKRKERRGEGKEGLLTFHLARPKKLGL